MRHSIRVDWPGGEWLTREQAIEVTGIPEASFQRLIDAGVLPVVGDNQKVQRWHWHTIYCVSFIWERLLEVLTQEK